jgi:hypothetical protein
MTSLAMGLAQWSRTLTEQALKWDGALENSTIHTVKAPVYIGHNYTHISRSLAQ